MSGPRIAFPGLYQTVLWASDSKTNIEVAHSLSTDELFMISGCCRTTLAEEENGPAYGTYWYCLKCENRMISISHTWRMSIYTHNVILKKWISQWTGLRVEEFELRVEA